VFGLPGDEIVVADALVLLAESDDEVIGVRARRAQPAGVKKGTTRSQSALG